MGREKGREMTAKDKASTLFSFYADLVGRHDDAVYAAIRVAEEIMTFMQNDDLYSGTAYWANHPQSNYWLQVIEHLKKMQ